MSRIRIEFICLGNICRSPMAEAIFLHKAKAAGISSAFVVDSSGTGATWHLGEKADHRTRAELQKNGIACASRARQLYAQDLAGEGWLVVMDHQNQRDVQALVDSNPDSRMRVVLMRDYDSVAPGADVPDPYYGGQQGFTEVYTMLDRSCEGFLKAMIQAYDL